MPYPKTFEELDAKLKSLSQEKQREYHQKLYSFNMLLGDATNTYNDIRIEEETADKLKNLQRGLSNMGGWGEMPDQDKHRTAGVFLEAAGDPTEILLSDTGYGQSVYEYLIDVRVRNGYKREEAQKRLDDELTNINENLGLDINLHAVHIGKKAYAEERRKEAEERARREEEARLKREAEERVRLAKEEKERQRREARNAEAEAQQALADKHGSNFRNRDLLENWDEQISQPGANKPIGQATSTLHSAFSDYAAALEEELAAVQAEIDNPPQAPENPEAADLPPVEDPQERKARLQAKLDQARQWKEAFGTLKTGPTLRDKLNSPNEAEKEQAQDAELSFLKGTAPLTGFAGWLNSEEGTALFHEVARNEKKKGKSLDELNDAAQMFDRMSQFGVQDAAAIQKIKSPYLSIGAAVNKNLNGKDANPDKAFFKDLIASLKENHAELRDGTEKEKQFAEKLRLLIERAENLENACRNYDPKRPGKNVKDVTEKTEAFDQQFFEVMASEEGNSLFKDEARQWRAMKYRAKSANYTEKTWKNYLEFHTDVFWEHGKEDEYIAKALTAYYHVNAADPKERANFSKKRARKEAETLRKDPAFQYLMKTKGKDIQQMIKEGKYAEVSKMVSQPFVTNDRNALKKAYADLEKQHRFFLDTLRSSSDKAGKEFKAYSDYIGKMVKEYRDRKGNLTEEEMGVRLGEAFKLTEKFLKGRKAEKTIGSDEELMTRYALDSMDIFSRVSGAGKAKVKAIFDRTNEVRTNYGRRQTEAKFGQFDLVKRLDERTQMSVNFTKDHQKEQENKLKLNAKAIKAGDDYKVEDLPEVDDKLDMIEGFTEMDQKDPKKPLPRELVYVDDVKKDIQHKMQINGKIGMDYSYRLVRNLYGLSVTPVFKQKQRDGSYKAVCFKDSMDYRIQGSAILPQASEYQDVEKRQQLAQQPNPFHAVRKTAIEDYKKSAQGAMDWANQEREMDIDTANRIDDFYGVERGQNVLRQQPEAGQQLI